MSALRFQRAPLTFVFAIAASHCLAANLEGVRLSDDGTGFALESGALFTPWGFNYDHDLAGRLLEDYWDDEWPMIAEDFREMKELGATVVRIHLQFGKFMESAGAPNRHSLEQLARLVKLAEHVGLYLDLTGLGCYHKKDVPPWYDKLEEEERWKAQAAFWEAVAKTCAESPAIFCYDLMNEPVVPGGRNKRDDWLGPAFAGKHFVQFITLEQAERERPDIARQWIHILVTAIREQDKRHLITVGLVPWSLDRPGMTSGFVPEKIANELDFIAMHIYPEKGKVKEAVETVKGFAAVGKPVVIEETFSLKCSLDEMVRFIDGSKSAASGWISFYWGKTPGEYRRSGTPGDAVMANWLDIFQEKTSAIRPPFHGVRCAGTYPHHLQGICADNEAIYWCFTTQLVKTDLHGNLLRKVPVANHHGDLCFHEGMLYVAVNLGKFNDPEGNADSWVYVYEADDLSAVSKHEVREVFHGAGGIGLQDSHFFVVGGLPDDIEENYVYEYNSEFRFIKKHVVESGHTHLGIQTAAFAKDRWWFGCYGNPKTLLVTDAQFNMTSRSEFDCSLGIVGLPDGRFLAASGRCESGKGCTGWTAIAVEDDERGLRIQKK